MREGVATLPDGLELAYETLGDHGGRPLLLIMGLSGPGLWWDVAFCEQLAARGFHVVRFDNRDIGRSSQLNQHRVSRRLLAQAFLGRKSLAPYPMQHLADDAFGLLDHLGIEQAHVTGVSMGGMIAQTMAVSRPKRVLSLVSMMSTTGRRSVGWQDPRLLPMLIGARTPTREAYVRRSRRVWRMIGSPGYPVLDADRESRAGDTWDRGTNPAGAVRQMLAIVTQPDRTAALGGLTMPVTVLHGTADKMVHPSGGRATAAAVPGSELVMVKGLGHDMPPTLFDTFADAIERTADRAPAPRSDVPGAMATPRSDLDADSQTSWSISSSASRR